MTTRRPARRRPVVLAALAVLFALLLSACTSAEQVVVTVTTTPGVAGSQPAQPTDAPTSDGQPTDAPTSDGQPADTGGAAASDPNTPPPSRSLAAAIRITSKPAFGTKDVAPNEPITVTVFSGKIKDLTVTGDDGSTVNGTIGDDQATFATTDRMSYGVTYTFAGTVVAPDNSTKKINGAVSTIKPESTVQALIGLREGQSVGVGAPIIITFLTAVTDKAAAQKALKVTTDKGEIEGSWGWVQDEDFLNSKSLQSQVHFRPKVYWPANTKVTVTADLAGVNLGSGWGREDLVRHFSVGRSLVLKADVSTKHLVVWKDGVIFKNYPVSYGRESEPGRTTVSGVHIVQEKYPTFKMTNPQFGYYNLPEKYAIRINNNGEFIHHNEGVEKAGLLGKENVSHGCVNMGEADAKELFDMVIYGDPVEVSGTTQQMSEKDAIYDWKYSWEDWKNLSAQG